MTLIEVFASILTVMQGTSFAFVPIMIGIVKSSGIAALMGSVVVAGLFHAALGTIIGRIRHWFPPLVSGMVITTIGLYLIPVGIKYAAGGAADFQMNNPAWGGFGRASWAGSEGTGASGGGFEPW